MVRIRPYQPGDYERLRYICMETAFPGYREDPVKRLTVPIMYCDYFMEQEPEYVFVAVDEEDIPFGYIICATNPDKYARDMREIYYPRLREIRPEEIPFFEHFLEEILRLRQYPAHFHIDILPGHQRMGVGTALMDALCEKLRKDDFQELMGCMIAVGSQGYSFYHKYGFRDAETNGTHATIVYPLTEGN